MTDLPRAVHQVPVPRAIQQVPGSHQITPFNFSIRTMLDYDAMFMSDRIMSEIYVNGHRAGTYAAMRIEESPRTEAERRYVIETYAPELERCLVDEFMGLGYRKRVRDLEQRLATLQEYVDRIRWWQVRRRIAQRAHERAMAREEAERGY